MRKLALATLVAVTAVGCARSASAQPEQRGELRKQLEIMSSIFETALEQEQDNGKRAFWRSNNLSYNYLAGQGVVFRSKLGANIFVFNGGNIPVPPMPPIPEIEGVDVEVITEAVESGLAKAERALENIRIESNEIILQDGEVYFSDGNDEAVSAIQEASKDVREHVREIRDAKRRIRDLEFAKRGAKGDGEQKIAQELKEAEAELAKHEKEMEAAKAELEKARDVVKARANERKQELQEKRQQRLAKFEQTMASTLCDYGRTLRALPGNESVTFVLEGAGNKEEGEDKIYIFQKNQFQNCSDASDLLSKAQTYSF